MHAILAGYSGQREQEAAMTLHSEKCDFRLVSELGRQLIEADDGAALVDFTRRVLDCPRLPTCPSGDYCTILAASLLSDHGRHHTHDCED
jgi:hypothetical protein